MGPCERNYVPRMNAMLERERQERAAAATNEHQSVEQERETRLRAEYEAYLPSYEVWLREIRPAIVRAGLTEELRWEIIERDGHTCQECGSKKFLTVDHVFPVSLGGTNDPTNLQTLCRPCNCRKGARA